MYDVRNTLLFRAAILNMFNKFRNIYKLKVTQKLVSPSKMID